MNLLNFSSLDRINDENHILYTVISDSAMDWQYDRFSVMFGQDGWFILLSDLIKYCHETIDFSINANGSQWNRWINHKTIKSLLIEGLLTA